MIAAVTKAPGAPTASEKEKSDSPAKWAVADGSDVHSVSLTLVGSTFCVFVLCF